MIKRLVRSWLKRAGFTLVKTTQLPFGLDLIEDVRRLCQQWACDVEVIFDVGANIGQSALRYREAFPGARVIAFEPTPGTFAQLAANISGRDRVTAEPMALGEKNETTELYTYELSVLNSLTPSTAYSARYGTVGRKMQCIVETIDGYCSRRDVKHIDLLKIDTEGSELKVLQGARAMLSKGAVRFVYAEFNEVLPMEGVVGGALAPLAELLRPFGYKFIATYTDWIEMKGAHFVVSNVLFGRR